MLQTGLVEHAMLWPEAAATFKISEVGPFMLAVDLGAVNTKTMSANKDFWNALPDEVRTAIRESATAYRDHVAEIAMDRAAEAREAYVASGGEIVQMSADERAAWATSLPDIASEWASDLDAKGQPGSEMLAAYLATINGEAAPLRDWTAGIGQ